MAKAGCEFRVTALSPALAQRVRREMIDEFGREPQTRSDREQHQCRVCLKLTEPEERSLLLSHSPFEADSPYSETGPIFIHERNCIPYARNGAYPAEFPRRDVVLRAYNEDGEIEDAELVGERVVEEVISDLLADPQIAFLHARNSTYGCFMFRIDPGPSSLELP